MYCNNIDNDNGNNDNAATNVYNAKHHNVQYYC